VKTFQCDKCGYTSKQPFATAMWHRCWPNARTVALRQLVDDIEAIRTDLEQHNKEVEARIREAS
jgi:hypothetical protein